MSVERTERMKELSATITECDTYVRGYMMSNAPTDPIVAAESRLNFEIQDRRRRDAQKELESLIRQHIASGGKTV
ncbi:MAG: hypothetical protein KF742_06460 [Cryobacterium sp.]|nr:hypothetical protein [Cryobacterium sp.]